MGSKSAGDNEAPDPMWSATPLGEDTWLVTLDGCTGYLVVGEERGVMIDTGFGTGNVRAYVQALTDKPIKWAVNTHGHFDHTGGNGWFEQAYMSEKAAEIAKTPYPSKSKFVYPFEYPIQIIRDGDKIDLGGRELEVIEIPAHAPSSVAFLDSERRLLFSGDEVAPFVMLYWQQDDPQPTVEQWARNMERIVARRSEFDHLCWGHGEVLLDGSVAEDCFGNAQRILAGHEGEPMTLREDGPEDFVMYRLESKRVSTHKGSQVGYDLRYVFDKD